MNLLEPGYEYMFKFSFYDSRMNTWKEQRDEFRFRVELEIKLNEHKKTI